MASGLWQFVSTDGQLRPTNVTQLYQLTLQMRDGATSMEEVGDYWDQVYALLLRASQVFGVERDDLILYLYSDANDIVRIIAAERELVIDAVAQPVRVEVSLYVDPQTGLITRPGLLTETSALFPAATPVSRNPASYR